MAFMSPLGLVVKSKPLGQKRKQELEVEIQEKKSRGNFSRKTSVFNFGDDLARE
ncbi:hypothetical protein MKX03_000582, partial [Papaver bracteatum]